MSRPRRLAKHALYIAAVGVIVVLAGCGVPRGSTATVADEEVPYHLLGSTAEQSSAAPTGNAATLPSVFYVDANEQLVRRPLHVGAADTESVVAAVLKALADGPSEDDRARGLASALGPDIGIQLLDVADNTAHIAIVPSARNPTADRLPLAVGQIVLSATSVEGVDQVTLEEDGQPLSAPLPGGEQTSDPLARSDYASLLAERSQQPAGQ
jgi:spore germination protein GerM